MMAIRAIFWDVGGVILSNAWDQQERSEAAAQFGLDHPDFEDRHEQIVARLEIGQITLEEYLDQTVFYRPRAFTKEQFRTFLFGRSREQSEIRAVLDEITACGRYRLATLNNESLELNEYRIRKFQLTRNFADFFTSCYLGARKPDPRIYQLALGITQLDPGECIFIDDREPNTQSAHRLGMRTIQYRTAAQLREELFEHGVRLQASDPIGQR